MDQRKINRSEHGQILVLLSVLIPLLIIFVGLSLDLGLAYVTKTTLSKSVDAAALAAMRNLNQGQSVAATGRNQCVHGQLSNSTGPRYSSDPDGDLVYQLPMLSREHLRFDICDHQHQHLLSRRIGATARGRQLYEDNEHQC